MVSNLFQTLLKALKLVAVLWINLAVTASGASGMVLCFGADGQCAFKMSHQGRCQDASDAPGHGRHVGAEMLAHTAGQGTQTPTDEVREQVDEPRYFLKLEQALGSALLGNPALAAFSYDVRAAEARMIQAGLLPNPELKLAVEEYDRGGEGFDSAETAVVLSQMFELGGKLRWRTRVAEAEGELAGWDYDRMRLDVITETTQRFMAVLVAQERLVLAGSAVELAEKTSRVIGERVKAGIEPPLQASKSEAELELARMEALEARNAIGSARKTLAAMWGAERVTFERVEGDLDGILGSIPSLDALRPRLSLNPDLARWDAELRLRRASLSSEKAARVPDVKASVGFLQFEEDGMDALAFGVGLPLPVFDRNQGNIMAAAHELSKAEVQRSGAELALATELAETHAALVGAHQRVTILRGKVVPAMEQAFESAHDRYRQGMSGFLDVLDAQRGLFEAKGALVEALSDYHSALTAVQRITATGIEELKHKKYENEEHERDARNCEERGEPVVCVGTGPDVGLRCSADRMPRFGMPNRGDGFALRIRD